jgi:hypothetical protein
MSKQTTKAAATPGKVPLSFMLAWPTRLLSFGIMSTLMIYVTFIALNTVVPAALAALMFIIFQFYDLDKKLPAIRAEISGREKLLQGA